MVFLTIDNRKKTAQASEVSFKVAKSMYISVVIFQHRPLSDLLPNGFPELGAAQNIIQNRSGPILMLPQKQAAESTGSGDPSVCFSTMLNF